MIVDVKIISDVKSHFWQLVDHWQVLITGILALLAAGGTIWATMKAADREVAAAHKQIEVTIELEKQKIARESYAFMAMINAAVTKVLEDIEKARKAFNPSPTTGESRQAYKARQTIRKTVFADLRSACIQYGGEIAKPFLDLEMEIDIFSSKWILGGNPRIEMGKNAYLFDELDSIERTAMSIQKKATKEMEHCLAVLGKI